MPASQSSINELPGAVTQWIVGLARFAALLFVLQLTIFTALGTATVGHGSQIQQLSVAPSDEVSERSMPVPLHLMRAVGDVVQLAGPLIVIILVPLLCLLVVISPFNRDVECRYPCLALLTVVGLLPLIFIDVPSTPWAASALPHLSNSLLTGGVAPLVATISMMSVAILIARRAGAHDDERVISNPAASRVTQGDRGSCSKSGRSEFTSSPRRRRMP